MEENKPEEENQENIVNLEEAQSEQPLSPEEQIAKLQEELLQARERTMRALADSENTRKRAMKDRDDAGKYAVANFARDMLAFGDNFARALQAMPDDTPPAVSEGLEAMEKELLSTFERHGIRKIEPLDEPFDANFHEVMFEAPNPDKPAGTIIQVIEAGYVLNDRLLRAAKVGIAKAGEENNTDPGAQIDIQG
jgi:molecular chaperone GrpE